MMLLSKPIRAKEGKQYGLIDELASPSDIIKISRQWALDIAEGRKPWLSSLRRTDKLCSLAEAREILKAARQQVKRQFPNMPQHQACLDSIEEGVVAGGYAGVLKEAKLFKELVLADTSKGLVHVFFAQRATSKGPDGGISAYKYCYIGGFDATRLLMFLCNQTLEGVSKHY